MSRFIGDLLIPGIYVVEQTEPEAELRARRGVVISQTTTHDGKRGWIVLAEDGRTSFLLDSEIHVCPAACGLCPRPDRPALRRALAREHTANAHRTGPQTHADAERHNRIRTLNRALGST